MTGYVIRKHTVFLHCKHVSPLQITHCSAGKCINIFRYMYFWLGWHGIKLRFHGNVHKQNSLLQPKIFQFTLLFMAAHAHISHHPLENWSCESITKKICFILCKDWAVLCWFHIDITFLKITFIKTHWLGLLSRLGNWQPSINQWQLQEKTIAEFWTSVFTNPGTDTVLGKKIEFQSSQLAFFSKRHQSCNCTNDLHCFRLKKRWGEDYAAKT